MQALVLHVHWQLRCWAVCPPSWRFEEGWLSVRPVPQPGSPLMRAHHSGYNAASVSEWCCLFTKMSKKNKHQGNCTDTHTHSVTNGMQCYIYTYYSYIQIQKNSICMFHIKKQLYVISMMNCFAYLSYGTLKELYSTSWRLWVKQF